MLEKKLETQKKKYGLLKQIPSFCALNSEMCFNSFICRQESIVIDTMSLYSLVQVFTQTIMEKYTKITLRIFGLNRCIFGRYYNNFNQFETQREREFISIRNLTTKNICNRECDSTVAKTILLDTVLSELVYFHG